MVKFQCMVAVDITVDQALILKLTKTVSPRCSHSPHNSNFSYLCIGFMLRKPCNMVGALGLFLLLMIPMRRPCPCPAISGW